MRNPRRHPRFRLRAIISLLRLRAVAIRLSEHMREKRPQTACAERRNFAAWPNAGRRRGDTPPGSLSRRGALVFLAGRPRSR